TCYGGGTDPVYQIGRDQHLAAAYYRNTVIHFFVNGAIAELALLGAAERTDRDPTTAFWDEALALRDLLKFEFFFADKDTFRHEREGEIALHDPRWPARVAEGPAAIQALVRRFKPFSAHRTLLPFLEAYRVVGDQLEQEPAEATLEQGPFLARCLG